MNFLPSGRIPPDVVEYLKYHLAFAGGVGKAHGLVDDGRHITVVVHSERMDLKESYWVRIWNVEYDPDGSQRGFDPEIRLRIEHGHAIPLLSTVYTRWIKEFYRRKYANDMDRPGPVRTDDEWEHLIRPYHLLVTQHPSDVRVSLRVPAL